MALRLLLVILYVPLLFISMFYWLIGPITQFVITGKDFSKCIDNTHLISGQLVTGDYQEAIKQLKKAYSKD